MRPRSRRRYRERIGHGKGRAMTTALASGFGLGRGAMLVARAVGGGALVGAFALAGCSPAGDGSPAPGGGEPAPQAGGLPDPCALITAADLTEISGVAFDDGVFNEDLSNEAQSICDFQASGDYFPLAQVLVTRTGDVTSQRASAQSVLGDTADVTVPGTSGAYSVSEGTIVGMGVGDLFVQVSYFELGDQDTSAQTIEVATIVAGNV